MKRLVLTLLFLLFAVSGVEALTRCPGCSYPVDSGSVECPKCLKLLRWPFVPGRTRRGQVVVRTGTDAFIRHPQAQNRAWPTESNAGADTSGEIGVWGGPTTLRYLLKFDISQAFAMAGVDINRFKLRRAFLKIRSIKNAHGIDIPVVIYPLFRPFQEGTGRFRNRDTADDGCNWYYSAPLLTWHTEGGDFSDKVCSHGIIRAGDSISILDITEIIKLRMETLKQTGTWEDPGMIIMADPKIDTRPGFVTIFSLDSMPVNGTVRSPELYIE